MSQGELYMVITNKAARGKKGALVAMIEGVDSDKVIQILHRIPARKRYKVREITLDMASTMQELLRKLFPKQNR